MNSFTLAKSAGFCFGVDRAVKIALDIAERGERAATLGPLIHNFKFTDYLAQKGIRIIESLDELEDDETLIIRSHGVGKSIYNQIEAAKLHYMDATCPYVEKIHKIVTNESNAGKTVIILGDEGHPEVAGIIGHCGEKRHVCATFDDFEKLLSAMPSEEIERSILVSQTTLDINFWGKCAEFAKKHYTNIKIFDTICSATNVRQSEAADIAAVSDMMIVIGDRHSSNTKKLGDVCRKFCRTLLIETAGDLPSDFSGSRNIGITAGASTPADIIKEVLKRMSEILRNQDEDMDFATMLEQSLESEKIYNGKRVTGIVTSFNNSEVHVDIGAKQAGIIPADELTDDPSLSVSDIVNKGDSIELMVVKVNDQEGIVTLSKKRCDAALGFEKIKTAYEQDAVLDAVITDVVRGGVLAYVCGTKIFVPASQVSDSRVENLETMLRKNVKLKIIEINELRNRAKGSVRAVLSNERKEQQAKFWDEVEVGKKYKGEVKSITSYGAFVDLGGVDGMIHITELSWKKIKHPSEAVKVGDIVEVYIKDIDKEKKRISLGYKNTEENPWTMFVSNYKVDDVVKVTLVSFTGYGAFAEIVPGVDGLIHISQIANKRVEKVADILKIGEEVEAKIVEIDEDKKRVSLSIRALLPEEEQKQAATDEVDEVVEAVEEVAEEVKETVAEVEEETAE